VEQKSVGGAAELVLGLDATTATRVVSSRSRLVENVRLRPAPRGAEARIALRAGAVNVKEMVLQSPNRIVLDISPAKPAAAAAPKPAPAPTPTRTAAAPKPTPAASPTRVAPTPTPSPAAAKSASETKPPTSPTPTGRVLERSVAAVAADQDTGEEADAASGAPSADDLEARAMARKRTEAMAAAQAAKAAAKPEKAVSAEPAAAEPSLLDRLGGGDPGMGLTIALGGVAFLLAAFLLLRRRSQRIAQEAAEAPWPPPGAEERPEAVAAAGAEDEPLVPVDDGPLFAATERDDDEGDEPVVELPEAPVDAEPEIVAKAESPAVEELERRIERLEARLADSLDARERLERQLAAHTEELRVQRAAIARTQRAVRAAVRGPDAPEQPAAQRVPSQVTSPSADSQPGGGEG
ncbi:MAG TPA: hypothetical protein VKB65_02375, partial [Myxococcota bacterium]|nr:hypothetical protein [Myxococcota bacterium]